MRWWETEQQWRNTLDTLMGEINATYRPSFRLLESKDKEFLLIYREKLSQRFERVKRLGDPRWRERYDA